MNAPDRIQQFEDVALQLGMSRERTVDWALYERLKRDAMRDFPNTSPAEYERLIAACAKAAGV